MDIPNVWGPGPDAGRWSLRVNLPLPFLVLKKDKSAMQSQPLRHLLSPPLPPLTIFDFAGGSSSTEQKN
jgi:hypothetical protein